MTDANDQIIDPDELDTLLEQLVAGTSAPGAPAWSGRVAMLVQAAQAPADPDELAGEHDIVRRMGEVVVASPTDDEAPRARVGAPTPLGVVDLADRRAHRAEDEPHSPAHVAARSTALRHRLVRGAGRVVAAKAAAATTAVLGVAAAAATTGIVVTMVVPAIGDLARKPEPARVTTERRPPVDDTTPSTGAGSASDGRAPAVTCPSLVGCDMDVPAPSATTLPPTTSTTVRDASTTAPEATSTSLPETTTIAGGSTTSDTSTTTVPDPPGQGQGQGQGRPSSPGQGGPPDRS